jgi:hypothetical protein
VLNPHDAYLTNFVILNLKISASIVPSLNQHWLWLLPCTAPGDADGLVEKFSPRQTNVKNIDYIMIYWSYEMSGRSPLALETVVRFK